MDIPADGVERDLQAAGGRFEDDDLQGGRAVDKAVGSLARAVAGELLEIFKAVLVAVGGEEALLRRPAQLVADIEGVIPGEEVLLGDIVPRLGCAHDIVQTGLEHVAVYRADTLRDAPGQVEIRIISDAAEPVLRVGEVVFVDSEVVVISEEDQMPEGVVGGGLIE